MDTDNRVAPSIAFFLLIWVAKLETSQLLQSNKNKTYRGRFDHLSVSIVISSSSQIHKSAALKHI